MIFEWCAIHIYHQIILHSHSGSRSCNSVQSTCRCYPLSSKDTCTPLSKTHRRHQIIQITKHKTSWRQKATICRMVELGNFEIFSSVTGSLAVGIESNLYLYDVGRDAWATTQLAQTYNALQASPIKTCNFRPSGETIVTSHRAQLVQSKITHCWILLRYKMSERKFALECTSLFRSSLEDSLQKHI